MLEVSIYQRGGDDREVVIIVKLSVGDVEMKEKCSHQRSVRVRGVHVREMSVLEMSILERSQC